MAKRRGRRDHFTIATDPVSVLVSPAPVTLEPIYDRRFYHPDGPNQPVLNFSGVPATVTTEVNRNVGRKQRQRAYSTKARLVFADASSMASDGSQTSRGADTTPVCVRRRTRREVIFAKGKGGSRHKRRVRRNRNSDVGC